MLYEVKTVLPLLLLIGPSVSLEFHFALCTHLISLRHTIFIFDANATTLTATISRRNFPLLSAPLLLRSQCLIKNYIYGEEKGRQQVKYVHMS